VGQYRLQHNSAARSDRIGNPTENPDGLFIRLSQLIQVLSFNTLLLNVPLLNVLSLNVLSLNVHKLD